MIPIRRNAELVLLLFVNLPSEQTLQQCSWGKWCCRPEIVWFKREMAQGDGVQVLCIDHK